ncbi:MAG: restriction endonuclease [Fimbriimonadaceae bacterium]|nr:restriction endonuclease [Fimbriimonadaceae bacterium]
MEVPKFYEFFEPVLQVMAQGDILKPAELEERVVKHMKLPSQLYGDVTPKSRRPRITDRVLWSLTYLTQSGLLRRPVRGQYEITEEGRNFLRNAERPINLNSLEYLPKFREFKERSGPKKPRQTSQPELLKEEDYSSPHERISDAFSAFQELLHEEIRLKLISISPEQFERLVLELLHKMGYGIPDDLTAIHHTGKSGDGGIDGVIHLDKLGLDKICLQAKKYAEGTIPRKDVQAFVGALSGQGATRGVFLTTATFSRDAVEYARQNQQYQISLIDGVMLSKMLAENLLGVVEEETYVVKRLDSDYFDKV